MNIGDFFIKISTQGDTKELQKTIERLKDAEKQSQRLVSYLDKLKKATSENEKKLIKENFARQVQIDRLSKVKQKQDALISSVRSGIGTATKMAGALAGLTLALDRMGNSLLQSNQMFMTFEKQSGISISRLNRMAGLARLSGMNLAPEQVAGDLQGLQQRIFRLGMTGEGSGIFAQLGINPMGMKSDRFIEVLRRRMRGLSAEAKSYILSELGLSQEWLNVIDLSNEKFAEYVKTSKELQLTEKERKQLAEYTFKQQKINMRFELAKQKFLIGVMPTVQKIMESVSKITLDVIKIFEKNPPAWLNAIKDILLLFASFKVLNGIKALSGLLAFGGASMLGGGLAKGGAKLAGAAAGGGLLAGMFGKGAIKGAAVKGALATGSNFMGIAGLILKIGLGIWAIHDILAPFFRKENAQASESPLVEPVETGARYNYNNVKSNMTNNFFNNPQPTQQIIDELINVSDTYLAARYI